MLSSTIFSMDCIRFSMVVRLCLQLRSFRQKAESNKILTYPFVCFWKVSLQCRAATPPLKEPTNTTFSRFSNHPLPLRQLIVSSTILEPRKQIFWVFREIGSRLPRQLPPSQLLMSTLYQFANSPGPEADRIPLRVKKSLGQFLLEPKSLLAHLRQLLREELRSYSKHHPLGADSNMISILFGALEGSSGSQRYRAEGEPSRQTAPFLVESWTNSNMLKPRPTANRMDSINPFFIPKLITIRNSHQQEFITKHKSQQAKSTNRQISLLF